MGRPDFDDCIAKDQQSAHPTTSEVGDLGSVLGLLQEGNNGTT
ncbi:hypothetical protein J2S35_000295 [Falsarthrobacter nasiphocae]|uniref:Uncharacterized protein n=1 Tax=Falsarthrobacter nasiphocae TaxID=189863 RepID=A0AAE4C7E1_9MICC|nr:hypothetical protein [Falsarthrobacter nasiphocae]